MCNALERKPKASLVTTYRTLLEWSTTPFTSGGGTFQNGGPTGRPIRRNQLNLVEILPGSV
ncbi:hypothetical protein CROQUDRAFT_93825 [Cronartium quercuum f. sp. fusiforme G11]|uniref:Uncharacterized protein n=1 Tax=Cronartium quercuum f. sp. fusiforme G11 TaxID=708437 RepID=A0A9P6NKZ8_9BASI|nr:hypothetical protein CROQUDRAFT_93825 [Cronartium quercuum f. sp. fusiforme G11]